MDELIAALSGIDNGAQRERERRRVNKLISGKVTPSMVGTEDYFSKGTTELKALAKGHIRGNTISKETIATVPEVEATEGSSAKSRKPKVTGTTAKGKQVHGSKDEWNRAFAAAYSKAPEGFQRAAGKRAYGAVKYHGVSVRKAVTQAVNAANEAKANGNKPGILV